MATTKIKVPEFDSVNKTYEMYVKEVKFWLKLTKVAKEEQAVLLAYNLPDNDPSGIKEKLFLELDLDTLSTDDGVKEYLEYMDAIFLKDDLTKTYEDYVEFDSYKRPVDVKIVAFINEFEKRYNRIKKDDCKLPEAILAFKLLDAANISHQDRLFVLTGVDYTKKTTLFNQTKIALKKYAGEQAGGVSNAGSSGPSIKLEPVFNAFASNDIANLEHTLNAYGFFKKSDKKINSYKKSSGSSSQQHHKPGKARIEKPMNPKGDDGKPFLCSSCGSYRHMLPKCPDSYENLQKNFGGQQNYDDIALFANKGLLGYEASNKAVIDTGCSSTVAGQDWVNTFIETLTEKEKKSVVYRESKKYYKFGSGVLKAINSMELPCQIGDKNVRLTVDIVDSDIPLLLSAASLKKAGGMLDLVNDKIKLFDQWVTYDLTSSGLFVISLGKTDQPLPILDVCIALEEKDSELSKKQLLKLHRQFGHLVKERLCNLLKDAGKWKESYRTVLDDIYDSCKTCKLFAKVPPRPVSALPPATYFGEVLTVDLKECTGHLAKKYKYILHLIDAFTRYSVSVFLERKLTTLVVKKIFSCWVSKYGSPNRIWSDLGGEFNSEEIKEMSAALGIDLGSGGAYAGWMNGNNERNHQVIDFCIEKILHSDPTIDPEIALSWALNAKNTMKMYNGFSAHQLVFGKNPNLPSVTTDKLPALEGCTTSKTVADQLNTFQLANEAFIKSECSERIRRALRHNVRSVEDAFERGQKVYYYRDGGKLWRGPATVIGSDGCVAVIKHQEQVYRVATSRLKHVGKEFLIENDAQTGDKISLCGSRNEQDIDCVPQGSAKAEEYLVDPPSSSLRNEEHAPHDDLPFEEGSNREANSEGSLSSNSANSVLKPVPKKNDFIRYKLDKDSDWIEGKVISRAGKVTAKQGRNQFCVNVQPEGKTDAVCVNLKKVDNWECLSDFLNDVNVALVPKSDHMSEQCLQAKERELKSFHEFDVYDVVKDTGQPRISTTWVVTEKLNGTETVVKARLVARGFQETSNIQTDSPTCHKDSFRIFLLLSAYFNWDLESTDIKNAFLQGTRINREVFVEPPAEVNMRGYLWRLKKCIYGLQDASRRWYFSVVEVLISLGCVQLKLDPAVFVYHTNGTLAGVIIVHVDDFLHIGNEKFYSDVVCKLRASFKISKTSKSVMSYIGLEIEKQYDHIVLSQKKYMDRVSVCNISVDRRLLKESTLEPLEHEQFRRMVGQLNWAARQTRPDLMFDVLELSMKLTKPCVQDFLKAMKAVQKLKCIDNSVFIPRFKSMYGWKILIWADAAFANLADKVSSAGGYVILLVDSNLNCAPLCWKSNKIKRKVRSTLAAEALILENGIEHALFLRALLKELLVVDHEFPIFAWTDSNNTFKAVHSTSPVDDRKLRLDIACLQENVAKENVKINWCKGDRMLANCLTKKGAPADLLLQAVSTGNLARFVESADLAQ